LQMIKKTHSVKCVSDTRDSGGVQAWERLTVKIDGRQRTEVYMETNKTAAEVL